jgi:hypothetical protein
MPSIMEMVGKKMLDIEKDGTEGTRNSDRAVAAITGGINSTAWEVYMQEYAAQGSPQLDRLLATDGTLGIADLDKKRAYLLGNAVCGEPTRHDLARDVATIDNGLSPGC